MQGHYHPESAVKDAWLAKISALLNGISSVSVSEIQKWMGLEVNGRDSNGRRIGRCLREIGWQPKASHGGQRLWVPRTLKLLNKDGYLKHLGYAGSASWEICYTKTDKGLISSTQNERAEFIGKEGNVQWELCWFRGKWRVQYSIADDIVTQLIEHPEFPTAIKELERAVLIAKQVARKLSGLRVRGAPSDLTRQIERVKVMRTMSAKPLPNVPMSPPGGWSTQIVPSLPHTTT